jgi:hypothetical protein
VDGKVDNLGADAIDALPHGDAVGRHDFVVGEGGGRATATVLVQGPDGVDAKPERGRQALVVGCRLDKVERRPGVWQLGFRSGVDEHGAHRESGGQSNAGLHVKGLEEPEEIHVESAEDEGQGAEFEGAQANALDPATSALHAEPRELQNGKQPGQTIRLVSVGKLFLADPSHGEVRVLNQVCQLLRVDGEAREVWWLQQEAAHVCEETVPHAPMLLMRQAP